MRAAERRQNSTREDSDMFVRENSSRNVRRAAAALLLAAGLLACRAGAPAPRSARPPATSATATAGSFVADAATTHFLDDLERRTFDFFWERAEPSNGLVPDRWPSKSFSSVTAVGFGLAALPIGVERGYVGRPDAAARALTTLRFLWNAPQGPAPRGMTGHRGFYYHFLDMQTGERFGTVELSSVDTALLLGGVLVCQSYFDGATPAEREIRELATRIVGRVDWTWMQARPPKIAMGWFPERDVAPPPGEQPDARGFHHLDWTGYNEAMWVYILALGSPTHPADAGAWAAWSETYRLARFHGQEYLDFAPLFGHQYSHLWVDFRGIDDAATKRLGFDYFESSRRATYAQRQWAIDNPRGWKGLDALVWGVSASDGPVDGEFTYAGEKRRFWTYAGRGLGPDFSVDDGTLTPTAAGGSIAFAPEIAIPALRAMRERYGDDLYSTYGFLDAWNPSFDFDVRVQHGRVVPGKGWFDTDYLGLDQGPILIALENHRSGLIWKLLRSNPIVVRGLRRGGFSGGWLTDSTVDTSVDTSAPDASGSPPR
jgi:hypothetical protein